jgi:hypothetical protein
VRLQTLPNTAVGALARSTDTALMLLAGIDASFDFDFNDYLHSASLCAATSFSATARNGSIPDLFHFQVGNFLTSSVIIVSPVSGNSLRAHSPGSPASIKAFRDAIEADELASHMNENDAALPGVWRMAIRGVRA